jgi:hypothetical protein
MGAVWVVAARRPLVTHARGKIKYQARCTRAELALSLRQRVSPAQGIASTVQNHKFRAQLRTRRVLRADESIRRTMECEEYLPKRSTFWGTASAHGKIGPQPRPTMRGI